MKRVRVLRLLCCLSVVPLALSCGPGAAGSSNGDGGHGPGPGRDGGGGGCQSAECMNYCPDGQRTTLSGIVTAPNGIDPIPGAVVYVPKEVSEFPPRVTCEVCREIEDNSYVRATTAPDGTFILDPLPTAENQPAGQTIQIVAQKGRFRRVVDVPILHPCEPNDANEELLRLPGRRDQYPNTIPNIAVATGDYDVMECVLLKLGLEEGQFDLYEAALFAGGGGSNPGFDTLLDDPDKMAEYNIIFLNCTNDEWEGKLSDATTRNNLQQYVANGGRLYVTDWSYDFIEQVEAFSPIIDFGPSPSGDAPETPNAAAIGADSITTEAKVTDPGMAEWLRAVAARTGESVISADDRVHIEHFLEGWVMQLAVEEDEHTKVWLTGQVSGSGLAGDLPLTTTFDYQECGRGLYSSYHTAGRDEGDIFGNFSPFPGYCHQGEPLSPQERVLEYLILHIADCLTIE